MTRLRGRHGGTLGPSDNYLTGDGPGLGELYEGTQIIEQGDLLEHFPDE
jgi:hypothetical protein